MLTALTLNPVLRELSILAVSARSGCEYERVQHELIASRAGASQEQIRAVVEDRLNDPSLSDQQRSVMAVVGELVREHTCSVASLHGLRDTLDDRQVVELLHVVGYYLSLAVMLNALGVEPESEPDDLAILGLPRGAA